MTAYDEFDNKDNAAVDFLIMGPGCSTKAESQAKANKLISIAEGRKDCVATVGPHRADLVGITNSTTQTNNLVDYFSALSSSSYAVSTVVISTHMIGSIISSAIFLVMDIAGLRAELQSMHILGSHLLDNNVVFLTTLLN